MINKRRPVSTTGKESIEHIASNVESSFDPYDPDEHCTDLADIIRIAMGKIETGAHKKISPCAVLVEKNYNVNQQSIY